METGDAGTWIAFPPAHGQDFPPSWGCSSSRVTGRVPWYFWGWLSHLRKIRDRLAPIVSFVFKVGTLQMVGAGVWQSWQCLGHLLMELTQGLCGWGKSLIWLWSPHLAYRTLGCIMERGTHGHSRMEMEPAVPATNYLVYCFSQPLLFPSFFLCLLGLLLVL